MILIKKGGVKITGEILLFSSIVITGLSFLLFFISMVSYIRMGEMKLFFISLSFLFFFIKGIYAIVANLTNYLILFDLIIIVLLYIAAAKK